MLPIRKKSAKKFLRLLSLVLALLIVALAGAILCAKARGELLFIGRYACVYVMTESMEPAIPARSYIAVRRVEVSKIQVGDVIVFRSDDPAIRDSLNTHRVREIIGDHEEFVTRGDHNLADDRYPARADRVVALYSHNLPYLTAISQFFLSAGGLLATLAGILLLCLGMYLPDVLRAARRARDEASAREHERMMRERVREEVEKLRRADRSQNSATRKEENVP